MILKRKQLEIFFFTSHNIRMLKLSLNKLKLIARNRPINGSRSMSKKRLLSPLNEPVSVKSENFFDDVRIKKSTKDFNELSDRFLKSKIKQIRRNLYEIEKRQSFDAKDKRD